MRTVTLRRTITGAVGTFGELATDRGLKLKTAELPSKHNEPHLSCIPPGRYKVEWDTSPHFGECYHVRNVPGRSNILIHKGNWAGDKTKGLKCSVEGCILVGKEIGQVEGQVGVKNSTNALKEFEGHMDHEPFWLTISESFRPAI